MSSRNKNKQDLPADQAGFMALVVVVILAAAALLMALNASLLGLGELEGAVVSSRGEEALSLAEGCLDEALGQLRRNGSYVGGALVIPNSSGSCIITITTISPTERVIEVIATVGEYVRRLTATATIGVNLVVVNTWQD